MIPKSIIAIVLLFYAVFAEGHTLGNTFEKEVGGYLVDIGYDAGETVYSDTAIRFDFNLWKKADKKDMADFDHVWVRIAPRDKGIVFAGHLYRPDGLLTGMTHTFQDAGEYEITVRFLDRQEKSLAETSFLVTVAHSRTFSRNVILGGVVGFILGAIAAGLIIRKKSR